MPATFNTSSMARCQDFASPRTPLNTILDAETCACISDTCALHARNCNVWPLRPPLTSLAKTKNCQLHF